MEERLDSLYADFSDQITMEMQLQDQIQSLAEEVTSQGAQAPQDTTSNLGQLRRELANLKMKKDLTTQTIDDTKSKLDKKVVHAQEKAVVVDVAHSKHKKSSKKSKK